MSIGIKSVNADIVFEWSTTSVRRFVEYIYISTGRKKILFCVSRLLTHITCFKPSIDFFFMYSYMLKTFTRLILFLFLSFIISCVVFIFDSSAIIYDFFFVYTFWATRSWNWLKLICVRFCKVRISAAHDQRWWQWQSPCGTKRKKK